MSNRVGLQLGNYHLLSLLGEGGFAEVYLAEHVYLKTQTAIKVLHSRLMSERQEAFLAEARSIARLKHANIVRVLEFGVEDDMAFLVMEYAAQGTLRHLHPVGVQLPLAQSLSYIRQAAAALQHAHRQQLMHRDVKPENMLLGTHNTLLLSDFGIAQVIQKAQIQQSQEIVGTITYMAPEQFQGMACPASDQYALGAVFYEWLTGVPPFQGTFAEIATQHMFVAPPSFRERDVDIIPTIEAIVMKALAKEPEQRYADIQTFAAELTKAVQPQGVMVVSHAGPSLQNLSPSSLLDPSHQLLSPSVVPSSLSSLSPSSLSLSQQPYISAEGIVVRSTDSIAAPAQPVHRRFPVLTIASLLMVMLLAMIGSSGLTYYTTVLRPAQAQRLAAATAQVKQAQVEKQIQATAVVAHQRLYLQATSGKPAFDSFVSGGDKNVWSTYDFSLGGCQYNEGNYHATSYPGVQTLVCAITPVDTIFDNFALQVEATLLKGDREGVSFRRNGSGEGYFFGISQDGSYLFTVATPSIASATLLNSFSPAIKTGLNQTNLITIIARGSTLYFYINKQYVTQINDSTTSTGAIALSIQSTKHTTEADFRNIQVWKL